MSDPEKPEEDATIVVKGRESIKGEGDEPQKAKDDPGTLTFVIQPPETQSSGSAPEGKPPAEPASPGKGKEKVKDAPTAAGPAYRLPDIPRSPQKAGPQKKGGGGALVLFLLLLLALGGGAYLYMQGSDWSSRLPFKSGADQRQESAQSAPAISQGTQAEPAEKHQWVQPGMPTQVVKNLMGNPVRVGIVDQMLRWEYDTGTELLIVRFQDDKVFDKSLVPHSSAPDTTTSARAPSTSTSVQDTQATQATQTSPPAAGTQTAAATTETQAPAQQDTGAPRYDQVQVGMTSDAVSKTLGEPANKKKIGRAIAWQYDTGTGYFEVKFERNKVVTKGMTDYAASKPAETAPPATASTSTAQTTSSAPAEASPAAADYDKIKVGMTPEAVTQILGKPVAVKKLRTSVEWEYKTAQGIFEVRFRNNKVSFKGMETRPGVQ